MVVTVQWQMSHARQPDVFQTAVLPPTQADSFLPRRSSLSDLLTIPQTLGGRDPGKTAKKKFQACAIRVLVGWYIDTQFPTNHRSIECIYLTYTSVCNDNYTPSNWNATYEISWITKREIYRVEVARKICANRKSTEWKGMTKAKRVYRNVRPSRRVLVSCPKSRWVCPIAERSQNR